MRVVAGDLRGRRIDSPDTLATRPTTDKVREAVFNALGSLDVVQGAVVIDLFAGTGAMGIEALSRGASRCTFVENDRAALTVLRRNINTLGLADRSDVRSGDALSQASRIDGSTLVIADPPYGFREWARLLEGCDADIVVLESDGDIGPVDGWRTLREKRYGRTHVAFLEPEGRPGGTVESE